MKVIPPASSTPQLQGLSCHHTIWNIPLVSCPSCVCIPTPLLVQPPQWPEWGKAGKALTLQTLQSNNQNIPVLPILLPAQIQITAPWQLLQRKGAQTKTSMVHNHTKMSKHRNV